MDFTIDIGPIRPPSEANSLLLRITRNCPWNRCIFCRVYHGEKFSLRTVAEIKQDIDSIKKLCDEVYKKAKNWESDQWVYEKLDYMYKHPYFSQIIAWISNGCRSVFLQDSDALVMPNPDILEILGYLKKQFSSVEKITTYSRSKTLFLKTPDELRDLHRAGLTRIHVGMESGSDKVLEFLEKGVTAQEHKIAGKRVKDAGIQLSEYYMPGAGGRDFLEENALESAKVLNAINPDFIRLRTAIPVPGTVLARYMDINKWVPLSEEQIVEEIKLFIENLADFTGYLYSDHIINLLPEVQGQFPEAKEDILALIDRFFKLSQEDKETFIVGRRMGIFNRIADLKPNYQVEETKKYLKQKFGSIDRGVHEFLKNYI